MPQVNPIDPPEEIGDVVMIRYYPGPPRLHFRPRGGEDIWAAALSNVIAANNLTAIPPEALDELEPHLWLAAEVLDTTISRRENKIPLDKVTYRGENSINTVDMTRYAHRFARFPTPILRDMQTRLSGLIRGKRARDLIERFFPNRLGEIKPGDNWASLLRRFLDYVETESWFPLDQEAIRNAFAAWRERKPAGKRGHEEYLANFLYQIPIPRLIPDDALIVTDAVYRTFSGIFNNRFFLRDDDLEPWGLGPTEINEEVVFGSMLRLGDGWLLPVEYGIPLRFLPTVARMYRRQTGFKLLDDVDASFQRGWAFTWDQDAARLQREWLGGAATLVLRWDAFHDQTSDQRFYHRAIELALSAASLGGDL